MGNAERRVYDKLTVHPSPLEGEGRRERKRTRGEGWHYREMNGYMTRNDASAFTLVELMVVLTISLLLMILIVPIFNVTTNTVRIVERKLALHEAARNIFDIMETEIRVASVNERGEHFSIKSYHYTDADPALPKRTTAITEKYGLSKRREADAIHYLKLQGGGFRYAQNLLAPGSQAFALAYPEIYYQTPEAWRCRLSSSLIYPDVNLDTGGWYDVFTRNPQLADLLKINLSMCANSTMNEHEFVGDTMWQWDPQWDMFAPGNEVKRSSSSPEDSTVSVGKPGGETVGMGGEDLRYIRMRTFGGICVMDVDIAYWDASAKKFLDVPDKSAIYFSPPPRAIRLTITVTELKKRGTLTMCRVVQIPVGNGACAAGSDLNLDQINLAVTDNTRLDLDPTPYNRRKMIGTSDIEHKLDLNNP